VFRADSSKVYGVAGLLGELFQVQELGTAVAFSEGVDIVHVADDFARGGGEFIVLQVAEEFGLREAAMNVGHAGFDVLPELELMAALGDFDGADFAGPVVDILEQMAVNGLQVAKIEPAGRDALCYALRCKSALHGIELGCVGYT
jgi:hypothetical protein